MYQNDGSWEAAGEAHCCDAASVEAMGVAQACATESLKRLQAGTHARDCTDFYQEYRDAVEHLSRGKNTVLLDDVGMPSVMVRLDLLRLSDVLDQGSNSVHPAFLVSGRAVDCIYYSKYQNIVSNGRGYSLPMADPQTHVTFDQACAYSSSKGAGWGLSPYALRAAIALWARKNGTLPRGNNEGGHDIFHPEETGVPTVDGRVATGSGPRTWAHNGQPDGIYDLNGNMNEWDAGLRLVDGEIQILPGSDCLLATADLSADSSQWRAISADGQLVMPGTDGTLRYHGRSGGVRLTTIPSGERGRYQCAFADLCAEENLLVPEILRALMLFPEPSREGYGGGWRWVADQGESLPLCGGAHKALDHAGVFFVGLTYPRTHEYELSGFRCAWLPPTGLGGTADEQMGSRV